MSDYLHNDLKRQRGYELHERPGVGTGWGGVIAAAAALVLILALVVIGGNSGNGTTEVHPGGAGAPVVAVPDQTAPAIPSDSTIPPAE